MRKRISMIVVTFIVMLFLLSLVASADVHWSDGRAGSWQSAGYYDTKCGVCGYDNPQWLEEDSVHYCSNCGALGMPQLVAEPESEESGGDYNEDWGYTEGDSGYTEKDDDGVPIAVVIGGGAAVGAAVTIILKAARKKKTVPGGADRTPSRTSSSQRQSENKQDQDQPEGYILNISEDNVSISPETSARLIATVLRVFADGSTQRDPSAPITVSLRPNSDLQVIPLKGFGEVSLSISQKSAEPMSIEEYIDITTVVSGGQKTARVKVSAAPAVQVIFF